jgi:phosphotransferase system enzyme I (PtsI)
MNLLDRESDGLIGAVDRRGSVGRSFSLPSNFARKRNSAGQVESSASTMGHVERSRANRRVSRKCHMQRLRGIAVSPGVAIGEAMVMDTEGFRIPRRFIARELVASELERLDRAIVAVGAEIEENRVAIARELGDEYAAIFSAHLQMLRDRQLRTELGELIGERHYSPEYAVSRALRRYAKVFQDLKIEHLSQRANDVIDIERRLLKNLLGQKREALAQVTSPVLVLAHDLTPSDTANLSRAYIRGFVTERGGAGSHTAIVAEGLGIPAIVGVGPFLGEVSGGDTIIIDAEQGELILCPDEETIAHYRYAQEDRRHHVARLDKLRDLPAVTADGHEIQLCANIEFPYEVELCLQRGCKGIGLYRTEFLYLGSKVAPDEETHFEAYATVVRAMNGEASHPVTIRTLDLGADKVVSDTLGDEERNPCLGVRSIRLSLRNLPIFRTQLRAILRASTLGNVRIMFPMVTTLMELRQAKMILADVMEDLEEHGIAFDRNIPVGMMVEVPSAVVLIERFLDEVDFISIGTNDLIQYALAVDRGNKDVADLYTAADPAVLSLIDMALRAAIARQVPVNLCGQMSGSPTYTMLLLGMGLRQFSVTPSALPEVKSIIRRVTIDQCQAIAAQVMSMENASSIKRYLKEQLKQAVPDLY